MATITSVQVFGKNGDPVRQTGNRRVQVSSVDGDDFRANQRFNAPHANSARVEGRDLSEVQEVRLSSSTHHALVIDWQIEEGVLYLWFLVWRRASKKQITGAGDLTVTIDTTPPANDGSGTGTFEEE